MDKCSLLRTAVAVLVSCLCGSVRAQWEDPLVIDDNYRHYEGIRWFVRNAASCMGNAPVGEALMILVAIGAGKESGLFRALAHSMTLSPRADATVRADRVLTLFMLNTLAENARKFTPSGGKVRIEAVEDNDWVEVSVQDSGIGLSAEDVRRINEEKVYDPDSIGSPDARRNKGSGFGIMSCRGIIEKYRKSDEIFTVCRFNVERSGVLGQNTLDGFHKALGYGGGYAVRNDDVQVRHGDSAGESRRGFRVAVSIGKIGLDVIDRCAVHEVGSAHMKHGTVRCGELHTLQTYA